MACSWDINYSDPDPETQRVLCRCRECGKYADLECDRDFASGTLIVQVMTCVAKGGCEVVRDTPARSDNRNG
jgi:hypothetical protein